jgi:hypothetical protein
MNEGMMTDPQEATEAPEPAGLDTPQEEVAEKPDAAEKAKNLKIAKKLFTRMTASRRVIKDLLPTWQANVEQRLGRVGSASTAGVQTETTTQAELNPDWALTKTKIANLYSQLPTVQGAHENKQFAAAIPPFMKSVNYELSEKRTNVSVAMNECLADVVNASGIAGVMVGYAARFRDVEVPSVDTAMIPAEVLKQLLAAGKVPMDVVPEKTDSRMFVTRISPGDLLVPTEFTGSNFDDGAFVGYKGRKVWSEAKSEWKLKESDKDDIMTGAAKITGESMRVETDAADLNGPEDSVEFEEIYYWRYLVDADEPSFCAIWKLVRVVGRDEPVVHEPWRGQKKLEDGHYIGSKKFPVRILTLTYISDNPLPPSDTEAGRPQVQDLRLSRAQMFQNRKNSLPMRWYDVNRLDPLVSEQLMRGTWQGIIPVNGDGSRSLGELARASYPSEDLTFDRNTQNDLRDVWGISANQGGGMSQGEHTKAEVNLVQQNFATVNGQQRFQVASFFLGAVEVLAGWMALYSDFPVLTQEEKQTMEQAWDRKTILHDLVLKILPDSTIVLDVNQKLERIFKLINMTAKSGYVNVKPLIIKAFELSGEDPAECVVDPQPPKSDDPNISYRFTGKDDMTNPMVLAILEKRGELPSIENIKAAIEKQKMMLQLAQASLPEPNSPGPEGVPPPTPDGPGGPPKPMNPQAPDAHPDWYIASTVAKRQRDI